MGACLVHGCRVDDVLEVFGDVNVPIVAELLDDLEAVEESPIVPHTRLPLRDPYCVVCPKEATT